MIYCSTCTICKFMQHLAQHCMMLSCSMLLNIVYCSALYAHYSALLQVDAKICPEYLLSLKEYPAGVEAFVSHASSSPFTLRRWLDGGVHAFNVDILRGVVQSVQVRNCWRSWHTFRVFKATLKAHNY